MHYTMKIMQNKSSGEGRRHRWKVTPAEARAIQEELREKWEGEDRLGKIRMVAGLDASFVLTESQALGKRNSRWTRLREANRAIGCVVVYRFPEMEEIARASAVVRLNFAYIPGLLSFREIPALLAALGRIKDSPDLLFCDAQGYAHPRRFGLARSGSAAGPANDRLRKEPADRNAWRAGSKNGQLGGAAGREGGR
jgi:deoxyribonuclease V